MWFEIAKGFTIVQAAQAAIAECDARKEPVLFEVEGTLVAVIPGMDVQLVVASWYSARSVHLRDTQDLGWPSAIADVVVRIDKWRQEVMSTLTQTQALVAALQQAVQTVLTTVTQLGTDFQTLSKDVATLIQDYQNGGGDNEQLIETINSNLSAITSNLSAVQTNLSQADAAITGEDSTVQGVINPPPAGGSGSSPSTAAPAGTDAAQHTPAEGSGAQGPLHGVSK